MIGMGTTAMRDMGLSCEQRGRVGITVTLLVTVSGWRITIMKDQG